jgi:hypothetical protein
MRLTKGGSGGVGIRELEVWAMGWRSASAKAALGDVDGGDNGDSTVENKDLRRVGQQERSFFSRNAKGN